MSQRRAGPHFPKSIESSQSATPFHVTGSVTSAHRTKPIRTQTHARACAFANAHKCTRARARTHTHKCKHKFTHSFPHSLTHSLTYTHTHTHTHTHARTHARTPTRMRPVRAAPLALAWLGSQDGLGRCTGVGKVVRRVGRRRARRVERRGRARRGGDAGAGGRGRGGRLLQRRLGRAVAQEGVDRACSEGEAAQPCCVALKQVVPRCSRVLPVATRRTDYGRSGPSAGGVPRRIAKWERLFS